MRWIGCLLMVSGWVIALASLLLLAANGQRLLFLLSGLLVELLGLTLLACAYRALQKGTA
jgi:hypothetical protein